MSPRSGPGTGDGGGTLLLLSHWSSIPFSPVFLFPLFMHVSSVHLSMALCKFLSLIVSCHSLRTWFIKSTPSQQKTQFSSLSLKDSKDWHMQSISYSCCATMIHGF